jgi:hypothetical protein
MITVALGVKREVYHQSRIPPSTHFSFLLSGLVIFVCSNDFARVLPVFAIALLCFAASCTFAPTK